MRINHPLFHRFGALGASTLVRAWIGTLDAQVAYYDPVVDQAHAKYDGRPRIYVFWHEYMLFPLYMRGHCNTAMLVSRHRDGEFIAQVGKLMGIDFVRGSTTRGGASALLEMRERGSSMNLAITPDGPKGPRRVLAPGAVFLASKLQMPLVTIAVGYHRPWRARSWDRFALPRPFSRGRAVLSPEMHIPADLDREGLEHYRQEVERMLHRLTLEAETWAETGRQQAASQPLKPQASRLHLWRRHAPHPFRARRHLPEDAAAPPSLLLSEEHPS